MPPTPSATPSTATWAPRAPARPTGSRTTSTPCRSGNRHFDGSWDVVVVDCAPTAETLRLLSLPEVLHWYMDRVFPTTRKVNRVVSPILGRVTGLPTPNDSVFSS
ncbi:ArsA-related P-loop ATPase, partial [Nostocoides australiense]